MKRPPITKTELKLIAQELDTSHGYLPQLVQSKPWLVDLSRQHLCTLGLCNTFPVFRTIGLMHLAVPQGETVAPHILAQVEASKELRPEQIVSTSLNPHVTLSIASEQADHLYFTGGMFRGGMLTTRPVIVRYDITPDRVILFVPALIAFVRSLYSTDELKKTRYRNRHGYLHNIPHIFRELEARQENEVIADVTGLKPTAVFKTDGNKTLISDAREILRTPAFDPIAYMKRSGEWNTYGPLWTPLDPMSVEPPAPTPEQQKRVKYLLDLANYVHEFFATPWSPDAG